MSDNEDGSLPCLKCRSPSPTVVVNKTRGAGAMSNQDSFHLLIEEMKEIKGQLEDKMNGIENEMKEINGCLEGKKTRGNKRHH